MARLYSNENFPLPVVTELTWLGHDLLTIQEMGMANRKIPDPEVLAFAHTEQRALLTINLQPNSADNYLWRGKAYFDDQEYEAALSDFVLATATSKENAETTETITTTFDLALYSLAAGNHEVAVQRYDDILNRATEEQVASILESIGGHLRIFLDEDSARSAYQQLHSKFTSPAGSI